uniref:Alpha/beta hydrolase fold-3 domain-containing protein n=1 Tax=Corethron hystrix TaxID=216773 RepID=A0A7S1FX13_9STRA|mmetsp:Transcript_38869/g.90423  ORF Transcript_38869/g.90423 Transcript_38869/m.90423 type:complete len:580 (+) Transcript_38869:583-2322(+)
MFFFKVLCGKFASKKRSESLFKELNAVGATSSDFLSGYFLRQANLRAPSVDKIQSLEVRGKSGEVASQQIVLNRIIRWSKRAIKSGVIGGSVFLTINHSKKMSPQDRKNAIATAGKVVALVFTSSVAKRRLVMYRMRARLDDSLSVLAIWQDKWVLIQSVIHRDNFRRNVSYDSLIAEPSTLDNANMPNQSLRRYLECVPLSTNKSAFWYSQGALRYMLVQKTMNLVYASIGTAIEATGPSGAHGLWMPIAAACASYYSTIGSNTTSSKAFEVLQSPSSDFIKRAWGMVSLPFVKRLSLEVSKFLKGAAIAERIIISGVPCFIICRNPYPALSTALKRFHRQAEREVSHLPDILEDDEPRYIAYSKRTQSNGDDYPAKDVIFHLTGGGFFTHTIAGDLPFLIDWSAATESVVICPEYDLLPEHSFPVAINQITDVFCALSSGDTAPILGFRANKIVVTGESSGGNLASSLICKLCIEEIVDLNVLRFAKEQGQDFLYNEAEGFLFTPSLVASESLDNSKLNKLVEDNDHWKETQVVRLPDGLMLNCPVLNLCESISPSRVVNKGIYFKTRTVVAYLVLY